MERIDNTINETHWQWLDTPEDHRKWGVKVSQSELLHRKELGLFTIRSFEKKEKIAPYLGEELTLEQRKYRYGRLWGPYVYFKPWGHPSIDAIFYRGAAAFANDGTWIVHDNGSYEPRNPNLANAYLERGWIRANRHLLPGEEILLDYGQSYWKNRFKGSITPFEHPKLVTSDSLQSHDTSKSTTLWEKSRTRSPNPNITSNEIPEKSLVWKSFDEYGDNNLFPKEIRIKREPVSQIHEPLKFSNISSKTKTIPEDSHRTVMSGIALQRGGFIPSLGEVEIETNLTSLTPVEKRGPYWVKRDDLFQIHGVNGGKARSCWAYLQTEIRKGPVHGVITGGSRVSPQVQIVGQLAYALGLSARLHLPQGPLSEAVRRSTIDLGHTICQWFPGFNHVLTARVKADIKSQESHGQGRWVEIPFGMEGVIAIKCTSRQVQNLPSQMSRIVIPVGSGMTLIGLLMGLRSRFRFGSLDSIPPILGVVIGKDPRPTLDRWFSNVLNWRQYVTLVQSQYDYHQLSPLVNLYGLDLDPIYEAKVIPYLRSGDLLWVVGYHSTK